MLFLFGISGKDSSLSKGTSLLKSGVKQKSKKKKTLRILQIISEGHPKKTLGLRKHQEASDVNHRFSSVEFVFGYDCVGCGNLPDSQKILW